MSDNEKVPLLPCPFCGAAAPNECACVDDPGYSKEGTASLLVRTAPERIYLQVSDSEWDNDEAFPNNTDDVTWCADSILDTEVEYVRADLVDIPTDIAARAAWHKQQWAECERLIGGGK